MCPQHDPARHAWFSLPCSLAPPPSSTPPERSTHANNNIRGLPTCKS
jgi:hypothetical protein